MACASTMILGEVSKKNEPHKNEKSIDNAPILVENKAQDVRRHSKFQWSNERRAWKLHEWEYRIEEMMEWVLE